MQVIYENWIVNFEKKIHCTVYYSFVNKHNWILDITYFNKYFAFFSTSVYANLQYSAHAMLLT